MSGIRSRRSRRGAAAADRHSGAAVDAGAGLPHVPVRDLRARQATSGRLWPKNPTLQNFDIVFQQKHFYLNHFWQQLGNSLLIAVAVGRDHAVGRHLAAFAISRLKVRGGRTVMNLALFTYFIPAAFLAVPMYKTMGNYGLLNNQWALILAMVTIASPYCIWVLKQASDKLPWELDEAARMDGASRCSCSAWSTCR
jgi:multiple sugar transport system permease protein